MSEIDLAGPCPRQLTDPPTLPVHLTHAGCEPVPMRYHGMTLRNDYWRAYIVDRRGLGLNAGSLGLAYAPGAVTVIPGWCAFTFRARPGVWHAYIHFTTPSLPPALVAGLFPTPFALRDPLLHRGLVRLGRTIAQGSAALAGHEGLALAHLAVHRSLERLAPAALARLAPVSGGALAELATWMRGNLHRPLSVGELAARLGCARDTCIRRFRAVFNQTPAQFAIDCRVARAAELLLTTALDLPAIAAACGFPNRNYLTRVFTRRLGLAPAAYRRRHARVDSVPVASTA